MTEAAASDTAPISPDIPATMRAVTYERYGAPADILQVSDVPTPQVESGEVLVRVRAAAVNPEDWHLMTGVPALVRIGKGLLRPKRNRPAADLAGTVVATGSDVTDFSAGDDVFGYGTGTLAELVAVPAEQVARIPEGATFTTASTMGIAAFTALQALRDKGHVTTGTRLVVNGAAGGVGPMAVQIAKGLGADVTAVCSTRNVEMLRELGADEVVDYTADDFTAVPEPYDVILDNVGNRAFADCRRCLAPDGRYVAIGVPKDGKVIGPVIHLAKAFLAFALRPQTLVPMLAKMTPEDLVHLRELLADGTITPIVERTYALDDAAEAYDYLGTGHARAKLVVTP